MRRKIISLHNISTFFRWVGFAILLLGLLATLGSAALPFLPIAPQLGPGVAGNLGFAIVTSIATAFTTILYAAFAFLISEMIQLMLRMEVDLKQIRFNVPTGVSALSATSVAPIPATAASGAPVVAAVHDDAIEIDLPVASTPEPPAKPAMDLYAERDQDVPFDVLITPKSGSGVHIEAEETADSSPEMPVFETHEEETPKVDTRPISYCPSCNAMIRYRPEKKGKVIKCPKCSQPFRIGVS
ncbi:zinc ribbon domain-containing protein [Lacunimicrobium album]